jgi:phage shock protein E
MLSAMNWTAALFVVIAFLALVYLLRRSREISSKNAKAFLKHGALLVDVRSATEFTAGHLPKAVNLPLAEIESAVTRRVKDKHQVLLLYCQSGMRSGAAKSKLTAMGYDHAFNLGSYARAASIVTGK